MFESLPKPRPTVVWSEMIRVCNELKQPAFAAAVLAEAAVGGEEGGLQEAIQQAAARAHARSRDSDEDAYGEGEGGGEEAL